MNNDTTTLTDLLTQPEPPYAPTHLPASTATDGSPQRNVLKFNERTKLSCWLNNDAMRARAAKESDATLATEATQTLGFAVTAANITSMRVNLGIAKAKPEKPAASGTTPETDLIELQKQIEANGLEIKDLKIDCRGTREAVNLLISHVRYLQIFLRQNANLLITDLPDSARAEFKELKPLSPLPLDQPPQTTANAA